MMRWVFHKLLRRYWNLRALDLAIAYAIDYDDWSMPNKIEHLKQIQHDLLAAKLMS